MHTYTIKPSGSGGYLVQVTYDTRGVSPFISFATEADAQAWINEQKAGSAPAGAAGTTYRTAHFHHPGILDWVVVATHPNGSQQWISRHASEFDAAAEAVRLAAYLDGP